MSEKSNFLFRHVSLIRAAAKNLYVRERLYCEHDAVQLHPKQGDELPSSPSPGMLREGHRLDRKECFYVFNRLS